MSTRQPDGIQPPDVATGTEGWNTRTHPRQPGRFLFVLWDGGGTVPPQLALARRLAERGHRVRILAPHVLRQRIESAGCIFVPLRDTPEHNSSSRSDDLLNDWDARTTVTAALRARDRILFGPVFSYSTDVTAAIADDPPDVVVTDFALLGAYIAAERAGVPLVGLIHMVYPLPAPGLPPYGLGFPLARGLPGRVRDAVVTQLFWRFYNAGLGKLNHARAMLGLRPLSSVIEQLQGASRLLVLTSQAFDFPAASLPANVRYVGPQLDDPAWLGTWELPADHDGRPLVVVSLSTTYQAQATLLRRIIAALAELPVRGLVTLGPAMREEIFSLPPNVRAEPYIPHVLAFSQADLVITHGGHGTVITALSFGVPVVCIPMGRDQADNAARVVWRGAGVRCSKRASVQHIRRVIQHALEEPRFREGARRVREGIARDGGPEIALQELESLVSQAATRAE